MTGRKLRSEQCLCGICQEVIRDAVGSRPGQAAIQCDGVCAAWLHRQCAGLSVTAFESVSNSNDPFYCPQCRLGLQQLEIDSLRDMVSALSAKLSELCSIVNDKDSSNLSSTVRSSASVTANSHDAGTRSSSGTSDSTSAESSVRSSNFDPNRKFNVIIRGIDECPQGTTRDERLSSDLGKSVSICSKLVSTINKEAIRDHFRLGKYRPDQERPRPIMVKFIRSADAAAILSQSRSVTPPVTVKRDMTLEARKKDSVLLKVRWSLIQQGIDRKLIKIRNSSLYVNNILHGQLDASITYHPTSVSNSDSGRTVDDIPQHDDPVSLPPSLPSTINQTGTVS